MKKLLAISALVLGLVPATAQAQTCEDTTAPIPPQVRGLIAISGTQAWPEWTDSTYLDQGPAECRAGNVTSGVNVYDPENPPYAVAGTPGFIDSHGIRNGADHEAITNPTLVAGRWYYARAWAMDANENSSEGNAVWFKTPSHYAVVVAGQVKQAASSTGTVATLAVSATKVMGGQVVSTTTDARGIYRLPLPAFGTNEDWDLSYGPGCFYCGSTFQGGPDRVTVGTVQHPQGRILSKNKTL